MPNVVVKQLVEAQVIAGGAMYTANLAGGVTANVTSCTLYNSTGGTVTVTVGITGSGVALAAGNTLVNEAILPGKTYLCPEMVNQRVSPGHEIRANGAGVTISVGGTEFSGQ